MYVLCIIIIIIVIVIVTNWTSHRNDYSESIAGRNIAFFPH